ncbi:hypothetical protein [Nocardia sp. SSK8]|uniref:hypothetical protein n=1 Tax=Nocardia sp. SSK8 TaxID=3120154 RepID=UPI003009CAE6
MSSTPSTTRRRLGWGAAVAMATLAVAATALPTAAADTSPSGILTLRATPPPGGFVVGSTTHLFATVGSSIFGSAMVTAADDGTCFRRFDPGMDAAGMSIEWTPTVAGTRTITLTQGKETVSETVVVAPAPPGTPTPDPETPGCQGGGSLDTGSFGS